MGYPGKHFCASNNALMSGWRHHMHICRTMGYWAKQHDQACGTMGYRVMVHFNKLTVRCYYDMLYRRFFSSPFLFLLRLLFSAQLCFLRIVWRQIPSPLIFHDLLTFCSFDTPFWSSSIFNHLAVYITFEIYNFYCHHKTPHKNSTF